MVFRIAFLFFVILIGVRFDTYSQVRPTERFKQWEKTLVFSLVMGDHFKNDSADIFIGGNKFFTNVKLISNPYDGCADVIVDVHKGEKGLYRVGIFERDSMTIQPLSEPVNVKLVFNGKVSEYIIDTKNGKYALFEKDASGQLYFRQSHRRPSFE
ncbi:MAG: hypothetical protein EOO46_21440 [Flavobacterium sp.]|nr:MAG: hypothetical protein EOO46_21440 [Flavobacterium sp.]